MKTSTPKSIRQSLHDFFFAEEVPYGAALARIFLPLVAAIPMWGRLPRVRELFTADGTSTQIFELFGEGPVLFVLPASIAIPLYGIMLFSLACSVIGYQTRWSLAIAIVLYGYFNPLDAISTFTKYSVIANHMLLLLTLSHAGEVWSVDAWLKKRRQSGFSVMPKAFPIWPVRLMQILFAFIYFGAGITKIQTPEFFSGEQMRYWMLSNWNYSNPIGEWMAMWSPILLFSAYITVLWETMFSVLVWRPRLRIFVLAIGAMFHLGTWVLLGLRIFPLVCIFSYFAFFSEQDYLIVRAWAKRWNIQRFMEMPGRLAGRTLSAVPRWLPASAAWGCLLSVSAIAAVEVELKLNMYGLKDGQPTFVLTELNSTVAKEMIRSDSQNVREKDKFFSFDLGTITIGHQLANRRSQFEFGEMIIAQCNLNPPHEDMWVECLIEDEQGRTIEQFGQIVTRETLRTNFFYTIGNRLVAGNYDMVLKSSNQEIYRRSFQLSGQPCDSSHLQSSMMTN